MRGLRLGWLAITLGIMAFIALVGGGVIAALTPPAIAAPAAATTQCEPLPAAATPTSSPTSSPSSSSSPSPSASASTSGTQPQLCVGVQVTEATIAPGNTATWTVGVSAQGGAVPGVTVTLATNPAGLAGTFTSSCPSGSGTATCTLGDLATSVTPASYQVEAEVGIPVGTSAGTLTLTATAEAATTPAMTVDPAAGQPITITAPSPTPSPTSTKTTSAAATATASAAQPSPTAQTTTIPPASYTGAGLGTLPAPDPIASTVTESAGSIASVLPVITPQVGSTAAANVQGLPAPSSSTAQAGTFAVTIGMSGQTAEILGVVILALVVILVSTRATAAHFARTRYPVVVPVRSSPRGPRRPRTPGTRLFRPRFRLRRSRRHVEPEESWLSQPKAQRRALPPPPPSSDASPGGADPRETGSEGEVTESSQSPSAAVTDTGDDADRPDELRAVTADLDDPG